MKMMNNLTLESQLDVFAQQGFSECQLREIKTGIDRDIDTGLYASIECSPYQIETIIRCAGAGYGTTELSKEYYNWSQINEIYRGLQQHVDVSLFADRKFDSSQMRQIRLGLIRKLDVSQYLDENIMSAEMAEIRKRLEKEKKHR